MAASIVRRSTLMALVGILAATGGQAQVVPVKTVPVAAGDPGLVLPSATLGMGSVTLALDDPLADPWANPALGFRIDGPALLGAPTLYTISGRGGSGRTFPVAAFLRSARWWGGVSMALQQIDNRPPEEQWIWTRPQPWPWNPAPQLSEASNRNLYGRGFLGTRLGEGGWSLGLSVGGALLDAVDGVDLLYANAREIRQDGSIGDVRLGLHHEGARDRTGIVLIHDRVSLTHDVTYVDVAWDTLTGIPTVRDRLEVNEDRTRTWGAQVSWDRSLEAPGWRLGTLVTINRKSHPKIPNYDIQNIPRDPGTTWAYETGLGVSRTRGATAFGLDVVLQPIWSHTWQEADAEVRTETGRVIPVGGRTIENDFVFANVILRTGFAYTAGAATVQGGLELRSYDYSLEQTDHVRGSFREQEESWMEWSPSLGAVFRIDDVELRYAGRITTGTGQPGVVPTFEAQAARESLADFIVAPQGPLTLQDATVMTHQVSVRIPIR